MENKSKKTVTLLVVLVVILVLALGFYILYDQGIILSRNENEVLEDPNEKDEEETPETNNPTEEKDEQELEPKELNINDEIVNELLWIVRDGDDTDGDDKTLLGIYDISKEKITVEDISNDKLVKKALDYILLNSGNQELKNYSISSTTIDTAMKNLFGENTGYNLISDSLTCDACLWICSSNNNGYVCNTRDVGNTGPERLILTDKALNYDKYIEIYETYANLTEDEISQLYEDSRFEYGNVSHNMSLAKELFSTKIKKYKHTFNKAEDGTYYWYSSEIIN